MKQSYYINVQLKDKPSVGMLVHSQDDLIYCMHTFAQKLGIDCVVTTPKEELSSLDEDDDDDYEDDCYSFAEYLDSMRDLAEKIGEESNIWFVNGEIQTTQSAHIDLLFQKLKSRAQEASLEVLER